MSDESIELHMICGGESLAAAWGLPPELLFSDSTEPSAGAWVLSVSTLVEQCRREIQAYRRGEPSDGKYGLELLHRAIVQGNQDAWIGVQQCLGEIVWGWLRGHPHKEAACRYESEGNYVALAFERFWQATTRQQVVFNTFAGALAYLRASLHGAILDTLRAYSRPREVALPQPGELGEPQVEDQSASLDVWEVLSMRLSNNRERHLAYLLYHCGLKPREIVRLCTQEWSDIQEIYRLRCAILRRILRNADRLPWQFHQEEENDGLS